MNFDKIKTICKKSKYISLYDTENCQWLGDNYALYPLYEHPEYNKDTIASVLSLDEKKKNEMIYLTGDMPSKLDYSDADENDKLCGIFSTNLQCMDRTVIPLDTSKGLRFIEAKYIAPFAKSEFSFYERQTPKGLIYIVVKVGLIAVALIWPCDSIITPSLIDELNKIADGASETLTNIMLEKSDENK